VNDRARLVAATIVVASLLLLVVLGVMALARLMWSI
jgi:hypothetical protein